MSNKTNAGGAADQSLVEKSMPHGGPRNRFAEAEHAENVGGTVRRLMTYFAKEKTLVAAMLLVVVFGTLCGVWAPSLQSKAVDIIAGAREGNLPGMLALMLVIYLCYSAGKLLQGLLSARLSQRLVKRLREELFGKIADLPIRYLDTHSHGDVMSRMTNDIENISTTISQALPSLVSGVFIIVGTIAVMMWYCWQLTRASIRTNILSGVMGPIMNSIGNMGFVVIAAFGGYFSLHGVISIGVISAFIVYARQFSRPINEIANIYGQLQTAIAGAERVFYVLDEANEDMSGDALEPSDTAAVTFEKVNFSYVPGHPVIRDFNLTVPPGKKVALVGATGSGKTTVVNLLMRFYDLDSGTIRINGQDIAGVARGSLRRDVAIVLQDTVLFSDTVRSNLSYANADATQAQLDKAVEMSRCSELLAQLPQGWETVLTGSGANISQGQRQLLAIARAFVADPRILILDEATSNVDTRTEKAIQDAMQEVMRDRTSIVIAHRLSTIRDSDLIIVMDQGRIVESGNHEELLAKKGRYYDLYMTQYAGFAI